MAAIMHGSICDATSRRTTTAGAAKGVARRLVQVSCLGVRLRRCGLHGSPGIRYGNRHGGMSELLREGFPTTSARGLLAACLLGGTAGWSLTAAGAEAPAIAEAYGLSLPEVGFLTSAFSLTYAVAQVPAGMVVDRLGMRRTGLWGLATVALAYAVASAAPLGALAAACRAIAGIGAALCYVSGAEVARSSGSGATGQGVFGGAAAAAGGAALLGVPLGAHTLGWRSTWVTSAALAVLAVAALLADASSREPAGKRVPRVVPEPRRSVLRDTELYRLAAVHAVTFGASVVLSNWAALVLHRTWGMSSAFATGTASLILLTTIVSRPLGGILARAWPARVRPWTAGSLLVGGLCVLALAHAGPVVLAPLLCITLGIASGLPFAGVFTSAQQRRPDRPAGAIGLINAHANLVIVVGTPLVGAAVAGGRTGVAIVAVAALWVIPLLCLPGSTSRRSRCSEGACAEGTSVTE
ncbi:nitrate/nitrite transporter [Streptomyces shenzhenensis]|uniref:MFS transporter n=1 Tax=Streptomyces shenzhenensis TaxID=943815 RepID=UPI0037F87D53